MRDYYYDPRAPGSIDPSRYYDPRPPVIECITERPGPYHIGYVPFRRSRVPFVESEKEADEKVVSEFENRYEGVFSALLQYPCHFLSSREFFC